MNPEKKVADDLSILLANRTGAYALFSNTPRSRYEGFYVRSNDKLIRILESIKHPTPTTRIINELWRMVRQHNTTTESFFLPLNEEGLIYELSEPQELDLYMDITLMNDHRVWGRHYNVSIEDRTIIIHFQKQTDPRDDNTQHAEEYEGYAALTGDTIKFLPLHHWEEHHYPWDAERNSQPTNRWVYKPGKLHTTGFAITFDGNKQTAINRAKQLWTRREELKKERETHVASLVANTPHTTPEVKLAYQCAKNALDSLLLDDHCLTAGLPWFHQCWTRDQLISTKALISLGHIDIVRKLYTRLLNQLTPEGMLNNMENTNGLIAADATGWLFHRLEEWLRPLISTKLAHHYIPPRQLTDITTTLKKTIDTIWNTRVKNGLFISQTKESWMDTEWGGDNRQGTLIEHQTLLLAMFRAHRRLTGTKDPRETTTKKAVITHFWKGTHLTDNADNNTTRPNIFIAAYIYPELLSKQQWTNCFNHTLPKLWLTWGGLTTIDKKHELYTDTYTGENNKSYHRGDSWYWLNNLAAIVLHRINKTTYDTHIKKILEASTKDILYQGATGHASELSSAKTQNGNGCLSQAWSAATYIELVEEIYGKTK